MRTTTTSSGSGISQSQSTYLALHRDSLTPGEPFSVYFRQLEPYYSTLEASLVFSIAKDEQNGVKARNVTYSSASSSLSICRCFYVYAHAYFQ
ncbi:hypothetical protein DPMN_112185 [Dreissena polymorpha]|uniref:Uncharacterized protein n=1 Tax=Dreissena polymorpha TaxID=45954 RepID=A0A9D4QQM9_DREPO|nr:hypothetical protein DPMN_112185 [Dreissena polymorpha]